MRCSFCWVADVLALLYWFTVSVVDLSGSAAEVILMKCSCGLRAAHEILWNCTMEPWNLMNFSLVSGNWCRISLLSLSNLGVDLMGSNSLDDRQAR